MEFCAICSTSFDSDELRIRCSGQRCHLVFHQRCVHLTEDHVRSWVDDDVGLVWYCLTCRVDFASVATSIRECRKYKMMQEEEEPSAEKRIRMDPSDPRLPPEVWTMIFQNLDAVWLFRVRLVCRDWNELVCSCSDLMDRFLLKLGTAQFVNDLDEVRHFLALGGGFTRAELDFEDIGRDKPRITWFESLGRTLTSLSCQAIPFGFLYELLRVFPNLKRLTLANCFEYGKSFKLNYQLTKLEELTICRFENKNYGASIFTTLQHLCPRLTVLKFGYGEYDHVVNEICAFVQGVSNTLKGLRLDERVLLIDRLIEINDLHLKRITIDCEEQDLLPLLRRHPSVERLHIQSHVSNYETLDEISRILPNLKRLKLKNVQLGQYPSSNIFNFPHAEFIRVAAAVRSSNCPSFGQCSDLRRLELSNVYLSSDTLASLRQIATKITNISFVGCTFDRSSDILAFVRQLRSLTKFVLIGPYLRAVDDMSDAANGHSTIQHLKFSHESKELLHALVELCPDLETLDVCHKLVADDMSMLGRQLKRLKYLKLYVSAPYYSITSDCLRPIPNGFGVLRKLQINWCGIPKAEVQGALQGLRKDVEVSAQYWRD